MSIATTTIGPKDHGRRMNLDDFDRAEGQEGLQYKLSRGVVTVTEIAPPDHGKVVVKLTRLLNRYFDQHPEQYVEVRVGHDCNEILT